RYGVVSLAGGRSYRPASGCSYFCCHGRRPVVWIFWRVARIAGCCSYRSPAALSARKISRKQPLYSMSHIASAGGQIPLALAIRESPGFDLFVTGENHEAVKGIRDIAKGAMYVWAQPGNGISHLLLAACMQANEQGKQVAYIPLAEHS